MFRFTFRVIRNRRLFKDEVYADCVLSDDKLVREVCRVLCKVTFRGPNVESAPPVELLLRAVRFHLKFRVSL